MKSTKWSIAIAIFAVLVFLVRIIGVQIPDYYHDEGLYARTSELFLTQGISVYEDAIWTPPLFYYSTSAAYKLFGINQFSTRLFTITTGLLTIAITYLLALLYFNRTIAILSAAIIAVMPLHVVYSRLGFLDVMLAFFSLCAIYFTERNIIKNEKKSLALAAVFFSAAFLTKYNAIIIWFLYWVYKTAIPAIKLKLNETKSVIAKCLLLNVSSGVLVAAFVILTGGPGRLVQMAHQMVLQFTIQISENYSPAYYAFAGFANWLSPTIYILLSVSFVICLFDLKGHAEKKPTIIWWLVLTNIAIFSLLPRSHSRHMIPALPFIAIACAYGLFRLRALMPERLVLVIGITALSGSLVWSVYEVTQVQEYTYWSEAIGFINNNHPKTTIHVNKRDLGPVEFYSTAKRAAYDYLELNNVIPDIGDIVILSFNNATPASQTHSPLDDNLLLFRRSYNLSSPEFTEYIRAHGSRVYTGYFGKEPAIEVYEINSVEAGLKPISEPATAEMIEPQAVAAMWKALCITYRTTLGSLTLQKILPKDIKVSVIVRCSGG